MKDRMCANCGAIFTPNSPRQKYCRQKLIRPCSICGKPYTYVCESKILYTCNSSKCVAQVVSNTYSERAKPRGCRVCGGVFIPHNPRQMDCNKQIIKMCAICGEKFNDICQVNHKQTTCGKLACRDKQRILSTKNTLSEVPKKCAWCGEDFIATHPSQIYCDRQHYNTCKICGKKFPLNKIVQSADIRYTCSDKCYTDFKFLSGNQLAPKALEKRRLTCIAKYGTEYPQQAECVKSKIHETYLSKTGFDHPYHNPKVRSKAAQSAKKSTLELKVATMLSQNGIEYITQYTISKDNKCHAFDFFLPKYNILIDADGVYYHAYLADADGRHSRDDYDDVRMFLIPDDFTFFTIIEKHEESCMELILDYIYNQSADPIAYNAVIFRWCRSIGFPYAHYKSERLQKDYKRLLGAKVDSYNAYSKVGTSLIKQFHKSMYDALINGYTAPSVAWSDDSLLYQLVNSRCIYKNDVDPSKILAGFNVSKICPCVSIFNPILTKYLIQRYLAEYNTVFDPFSGFSGRMLGTIASGKYYIGQDLNSKVIAESKDMLNYLGITDGVSLETANILESNGVYECLLTCPPYGDKEIYADETVFKSCDEWMDECLNRFDCKRYVFVVDKTEKYTEYIAETLQSSSHFATIEELVIVIDKKTML